MRVVDSSAWIEYFTGGPSAGQYADILRPGQIVTPTVVVYEVYKIIRRNVSEEAALIAAARLKATFVVDLTHAIAVSAADLSLRHRLAMADAIVYATALEYDATLVTADADFRDLPHVEYIAAEE
jgi:toxin FitB